MIARVSEGVLRVSMTWVVRVLSPGLFSWSGRRSASSSMLVVSPYLSTSAFWSMMERSPRRARRSRLFAFRRSASFRRWPKARESWLGFSILLSQRSPRSLSGTITHAKSGHRLRPRGARGFTLCSRLSVINMPLRLMWATRRGAPSANTMCALSRPKPPNRSVISTSPPGRSLIAL